MLIHINKMHLNIILIQNLYELSKKVIMDKTKIFSRAFIMDVDCECFGYKIN